MNKLSRHALQYLKILGTLPICNIIAPWELLAYFLGNENRLIKSRPSVSMSVSVSPPMTFEPDDRRGCNFVDVYAIEGFVDTTSLNPAASVAYIRKVGELVLPRTCC